MESPITFEKFRELLPSICSEETSAQSEIWTPEEPLRGHCVVASIVTQKIMGGTLMRSGYHCFNKLPDDTRVNVVPGPTEPAQPVATEQFLRISTVYRRYQIFIYNLTWAVAPNCPVHRLSIRKFFLSE